MSIRTPPHPRSRRLATFVLVVTLALIAAACGGDDDDSTATGDAGSSGGSGDMTISLTTPTDGAEVGTPFDVEVDSSVDLGEPDTGLHHVHLYYDGATGDGDYDLVYGESFTVERDLGEGEHTVEAVIANADHSLTDARDEITVNVTGSGGGGTDDGGTDGGGGGTDDGGGYDYDY